VISYNNEKISSSAKSDKIKNFEDIFFQIFNSLDEEISHLTSLNKFESYMEKLPHKISYKADLKKRIFALQ